MDGAPTDLAEMEAVVAQECRLRGYSQRTAENYLHHIRKFVSSGRQPREHLLSLIEKGSSDESVRSAGFAIKFYLRTIKKDSTEIQGILNDLPKYPVGRWQKSKAHWMSREGSRMSTYTGVLQHLGRLEMFGIKLGLENITALCGILGNPQESYKTIHVAGTNGKGSVVAMCSSILMEAGYKTGMYTSPHLQTFRERIQVNGKMISQQETVEIFEEVKSAAEELEKKRMHATYFEFTTAMAFLYFRKKDCDFAVVEVGMGGRLDATNVVKPMAAVITNIELEHVKYLGDTREKIAMEKAGIIKKNSTVIVGEKDEKIKQRLQRICNNKNSEFVAVEDGYEGKIPLLGEHQKRNAAAAVAAIKSLGKFGINISEDVIRRGIEKTRWHGRLEVVQENPKVILDAAHNPSGAAVTADYLKSLKKNIVLVLGISSDKDIKKITEILAEVADKIIVTKAKHRGTDCEILRKEAMKYNKNAEIVENVEAAVSKAINEAKKEVVVVTGSIFVIGEARALWFKEEA